MPKAEVSDDSADDSALTDSHSGAELSPTHLVAAEQLFGRHLLLAKRYTQILTTVGITRGLLGPREAPRVWERHLFNCAAIAELIPRDQKVIDVGSG
ncbi:MAG: RsmG family class I SAM-dependent methyltransferase, partial [Mycobacteriales bacterium]